MQIFNSIQLAVLTYTSRSWFDLWGACELLASRVPAEDAVRLLA